MHCIFPVGGQLYACVRYFTYWRNLGLNPPNVACSRSRVTTSSFAALEMRVNIVLSHLPEGIRVYSECSHLCSWFATFAVFCMLYSFFWVIPRLLNFMCRRFGTLFNLHRRCKEEFFLLTQLEQSVPKRRHLKFGCRGIT
jgi:hypothetical protein